MIRVAVLVGSLRADSSNHKLAGALEKLAAGRLAFDYVDIGSLPHYDDDLWANPPEAVTRFKSAVAQADAVLFVTPEFNRSFPAVIKNAIEWGSRPYGQSIWGGKPAAVVGTSPGSIGTAVAQTQLRAVLLHLDMAVLGQPEIFFQSRPGLIAEDHSISDEKTRAYLGNFVDAYTAWIGRFTDQGVKVAAE